LRSPLFLESKPESPHVRLHTHRKTLLAAAAEHPAVAVVLMGPMLWSRIEPQNGGTQVRTHVSGPVTGDVVLVTDTPALEALVGAGMGFEQALELGLVRLYGPAAQVAAAQAWLGSAQ
jgi:hypothetical protein